MAELCCLEISSRTSRSRESWSVILKVRKCACYADTPQLVLP
jgi:DNA mismatch repair protein MLH3